MWHTGSKTNFVLTSFGLMRYRTILPCVLFLISLGVCGLSSNALGTPPIVDERWSVTVNGQTVRVDPDGSFRIPNVSAADLFGPGGPGSAPDFRSDEWFHVVGTAIIDGVTWYAYSEPFQIQSNISGPYNVLTLPVSRHPPADIPESIAIEVVTALLDDTLYIDGVGGPGDTEIKVNAIFAGVNDPRDVTIPCDGTTYRTSNPRILRFVPVYPGCTPDDNPCDPADTCKPIGMRAEAASIGTAFITATNRGATAVQRFVVTTPCVNTLLVGRVVDSGGSAVQGAIVSTEGGSNAPTGTNANGEFSFSVCYTPGTPFSIVVIAAGQKAVLTNITPFPDGVTDVGTITLEGSFVFWNINGPGYWGDPPGGASLNWHTNSVPSPASHVFINIEDRLQPQFNPYTVTLDTDVTITNFTLDSTHATFTTQTGLFRQMNVTGESRLLSGLVEFRGGLWRGGTLINDTDFNVYDPSYFGEFSVDGLDVINNGRMTVTFSGGPQRLILDGASTFTQGSKDDDLVLNGQLHVQRGATFTMTSTAKGISVGPQGFLRVGDHPGATATMDGGTLTVRNCTPLANAGVRIADRGTLVLNDGLIDIKGFGDDLVAECGPPNPPQAGMRGALEAVGSLATITMNGGVVQNNGLFKIHAGATFNFNGGTITGDSVFIDRGTLNLGQSATTPAAFRFQHLNTLSRADGLPVTIPAGHTLIIEGAGIDTPNEQDRGIVQTPNDLTNLGTIILDSIVPQQFSSPASAKFVILNGKALTNRGQMQSAAGVGGDRLLNTRVFVNEGTLSVVAPLNIFYSQSDDVTYTNLGTIMLVGNTELRFAPQETGNCIAFTNATTGPQSGIVSGEGTLSMTNESFCGGPDGERTFENGGIIEPGGPQSTGTINVVGRYIQTASGVLNVELGGTAPGQFDKLTVSHPATLAGTLSVTLLPGYTPVVDHSFTVLNFGGLTGDFTTPDPIPIGGGFAVRRSFTANAMTLTVEAAPSSRPKPNGKNDGRPRSRQ